MLDQSSVLDSRRARRLARPAIQAFINVLNESRGERQRSLVQQDHLANPPARRIRFQLPQAVGWAIVQTQSAMNAPRKILVDGNRPGNGILHAQGSQTSPESSRREQTLGIKS